MELLAYLLIMGVVIYFGKRFFIGNSNQKKTEQETVNVQTEFGQPLSEEQIELLRDSWELVLPIKEQAAELFYNKLFELDPSVRPLFKEDMKEQRENLMNALSRVVNSIDRLDQVALVLQEMGRRHVGYKVKAEHYQTVGTALLWTLEQGLGDEFTDEVKQAWLIAYNAISDIMITAANKIQIETTEQ